MTALPRVMTVYGTRPEAIKMAPLVAALEADDRLEPVVAVTGQHREMLDQVNALFGIAPHHDLDLMTPGASLAEITARTVLATSALLRETRPDVVVVQGDTTTVLATSLAAFYERIPVVHLEAGLRTGDVRSPFPEEANRRLTAPLADLHLAPTATSKANLVRESIDGRARAGHRQHRHRRPAVDDGATGRVRRPRGRRRRRRRVVAARPAARHLAPSRVVGAADGRDDVGDP